MVRGRGHGARRIAAVAVVLSLAAGCSNAGGEPDGPDRRGAPATPSGSASPASSASASASTAPAPAAGPRLVDERGCPGGDGFRCATLAVPLDQADPAGGSLSLQVAVEDDEAAPRGVLLALAGGPGQAGVPLAGRMADRLGDEVMRAYRLVLLDQRGTGDPALQCPALQRAMGASDLTAPPASAVTTCAARVGGDRRLYSTDDVIADLELLRRALRAGRLTVLGESYGTFVAEQYALAHPDRTAALVLDSVVPHTGIDALAVDVMQAVRRVLPAACRAAGCPGDPVADVAEVVRRYDVGVELLDVLTLTSIVDPTYRDVLLVLRAAADGDDGPLRGLIAGYRAGSQVPAEVLSQGLHASALCGDLRFPWGRSDAPLAGREAVTGAAAGRLAAGELHPFDRATAVGNGFVRQCLPWPPTQPAGLPLAGDLPAVSVLLLAGDRDLSTPLEWARREAARAPRGELVVVRGAGHSVLSRAGRGQDAVRDFLLRR